LFGKEAQTHDEAMEQAFNKGQSYREIMDAIVKTELGGTIATLLNECHREDREFGSLKDQLKLETDTILSVRRYFSCHADAMREAVRF